MLFIFSMYININIIQYFCIKSNYFITYPPSNECVEDQWQERDHVTRQEAVPQSAEEERDGQTKLAESLIASVS